MRQEVRRWPGLATLKISALQAWNITAQNLEGALNAIEDIPERQRAFPLMIALDEHILAAGLSHVKAA